jgi:hypothetical protein
MLDVISTFCNLHSCSWIFLNIFKVVFTYIWLITLDRMVCNNKQYMQRCQYYVFIPFVIWFSQCGKKHDKFQIVVYQLLLYISIKCLTFWKHIPLHFYTSQNQSFSKLAHPMNLVFLCGHSSKNQSKCLCKTTLVGTIP